MYINVCTYIYIYNIFCNIVATHTHTGFTFVYIHINTYTVLVPRGEVLTGFEDNFIAPKEKLATLDT